jgi:hypothetical protein
MFVRFALIACVLLSARQTVRAQCTLTDAQDPGNGTPRLMCPINGNNYGGLDVPFLWDPDDEANGFGNIFPRLGEQWQLTASTADSTTIGTFPNWILQVMSPVISFCLTPGYPCSQAGSVADRDDWIRQDRNMRVLNDNGQTFWWQARECTTINCNYPWVRTSFKNGPSAAPGDPIIVTPTEGQVLDSAEVSVEWKYGDRARNHYFSIRGEQEREGEQDWPTIFSRNSSKPPEFLPAGPFNNYAAVGATLTDLGQYRDGRSFQFRLAAVNDLGQTSYRERTFRIRATQAPSAIDPNTIGRGPEWSFSGRCLSFSPAQPFGGAKVSFEVAKDSSFQMPVFSAETWFSPKSHSAKLQFCPPNEMGRRFWYRMRAWNQDYGYGNYWGSPYHLIHPTAEHCAIPTLGRGSGARDSFGATPTSHVESCLDDDNSAYAYKLWDKSRFFNRNAHGHNGGLQPTAYSPENPIGGIFVFRMGAVSVSPTAGLILRDGDNDWGKVPDPEPTLQQNAVQAQADAAKLYDMLKSMLQRNGLCDEGEQWAIGIALPETAWQDGNGGEPPPDGEPIVYSAAYLPGIAYVNEPISGLPTPHRYAASIGATGHAWAHYMFERCVQSDGLLEPEAHAVREAFADWLGAALKAYDGWPLPYRWQIENGAGGTLRDLANPPTTNQPWVYRNDARWWPGRNQDMNAVCFTGAGGLGAPAPGNQYCGRRVNAGVGNYAFYLLAQNQGASTVAPATGVRVNGIGVDRTLKIAVHAMLRFWTDDMSFPLMAGAMVSAADDLYGGPSSNESVQTLKAWQAVGVTPVYMDGQPIPTPRPCVGDCDRNGVVGINDLTAVSRLLLEGQGSCPNADVNEDGDITVSDLVTLITLATNSTCIPASRSGNSVSLGTATVEAGHYSYKGLHSDVVEIPISLLNSEDYAAAVLFDLEVDAGRFDSVDCYADPSLDDSFAFALAQLPDAAGKLRRRILITSDVQPIGTIPDGVLAVCEFDLKNGTPYGTYPISIKNPQVGSNLETDMDVVAKDGYIQLYKGGCAIVGPPQVSPADLLLMALPALCLLAWRSRFARIALMVLLLVPHAANAFDGVGSWERTAEKRVRGNDRQARRVGMPRVGMAGRAAPMWFVNGLDLTGRQVLADVRVVGVSFEPVSFVGRLRRDGRTVVGKLLNAKGRKVAVVHAQVSALGVAGEFKARNGERGRFEWTAGDPNLFGATLKARMNESD